MVQICEMKAIVVFIIYSVIQNLLLLPVTEAKFGLFISTRGLNNGEKRNFLHMSNHRNRIKKLTTPSFVLPKANIGEIDKEESSVQDIYQTTISKSERRKRLIKAPIIYTLRTKSPDNVMRMTRYIKYNTKSIIRAYPSNKQRGKVKMVVVRGKSILNDSANNKNKNVRCFRDNSSWFCTKNNYKSSQSSPSPSFQISPSHKRTFNNENLDKSSYKKKNLCSHPFHSWMCLYKTNQVQNNSALNKPKNKNSFKSLNTFSNSPPREKKLSKQLVKANVVKFEKYDKCSHPFHSWLCPQKKSKPLVKSPSHPVPSPPKKSPQKHTFKTTLPDNLCNSSPGKRVCKSWVSFIVKEPKKAKINSSVTQSTTPKLNITPRTKKKPLEETNYRKRGKSLVNKHTQHKNDMKKYNPCNHAFHSWLCHKGRSSFKYEKTTYLPPPITTTTTTTTTTTPPPSTTITTTSTAATIKFNNNVPTPQPKSSWKGTNPCNHAFHSWLCQPLRPRLKFKSPVSQELSPQPSNINKNINTRSCNGDECAFVENFRAKKQPKERSSKNLEVHSFSLPHYRKSIFCGSGTHSLLCKNNNIKSDGNVYKIPDIRALPLENEKSEKLSNQNYYNGKSENTFQIPLSDQQHPLNVHLHQYVNNHHDISSGHSTPEIHTYTNSQKEISHNSYKSKTPSRPLIFKDKNVKTVSFNAPTRIFKNIPNIGLLPLEGEIVRENYFQTDVIGAASDRSQRYIKVPSLTASSSVTSLNEKIIEEAQVSKEDIQNFLNFEAKKISPVA